MFCFLYAKDIPMNIYEFKVNDIHDNEVKLDKYKGEVLLIVNVASKCGFTPQYAGLEKLYEQYNNKGFNILAFPSNQFFSQEPGTNEEILSFCQRTYNVSFDMFAKTNVNGTQAISLYKYLKKSAPGILGTQSIKWNFTKFLINNKGEVIKRYGPSTKPLYIENDIKKLLN